MKLWRLSTLQKYFKKTNLTVKPRDIDSFFSSGHIFGKMKIRTFYLTPEFEKAVFFNASDVSILCQRATQKFGGDFSYKNCPSINKKDNAVEIKTNSFEEFNNKVIEHLRSDVMVEKRKIQKDKIALTKDINQDFASEASNLEVDFTNKKIVSIDFEFSKKQGKQFYFRACTEFGITVLENNELHYKHYLIEETFNDKVGMTKHLQQKFEFGESVIISLEEVKSLLEDCFKDASFMLCHDMSSELSILKQNGVGFKHLKVLDTSLMYQVFSGNHHNQKRLKDLLRVFEIPFTHLHNSGNDAAYTMQAFLEMTKQFKATKHDLEHIPETVSDCKTA